MYVRVPNSLCFFIQMNVSWLYDCCALIFFLVGLGFECRTLHLQSWCWTIWTAPPYCAFRLLLVNNSQSSKILNWKPWYYFLYLIQWWFLTQWYIQEFILRHLYYLSNFNSNQKKTNKLQQSKVKRNLIDLII
jgi:hypothetical protein